MTLQIIGTVVVVLWISACAAEWVRTPNKAKLLALDPLMRHLPRGVADLWAIGELVLATAIVGVALVFILLWATIDGVAKPVLARWARHDGINSASQ